MVAAPWSSRLAERQCRLSLTATTTGNSKSGFGEGRPNGGGIFLVWGAEKGGKGGRGNPGRSFSFPFIPSMTPTALRDTPRFSFLSKLPYVSIPFSFFCVLFETYAYEGAGNGEFRSATIPIRHCICFLSFPTSPPRSLCSSFFRPLCFLLLFVLFFTSAGWLGLY